MDKEKIRNLNNLRDNYTYYQDFYLVANEKSFTEAEKKYNVNHTSFSRSIKALENILDLKLVNTNNTGFELTIDGLRVYERIEPIFTNLSNYNLTNLNNDEDITITIGTTRNIADFFLSKYIIKFNQKFSHIKINILIDNASNLSNFLSDHKIDILIDYLPHNNTNETYNLDIKSVCEINTCFACSKEYYKTICNSIKSINDLKNYKLIIQGSSRRKQFLDELLQKNGIELISQMKMPDSKLMADVVKSGDYIGYFIEEEIEEYGLQKLDIINIPNPIGVIYQKNTINPIAKEFVNIILND